MIKWLLVVGTSIWLANCANRPQRVETEVSSPVPAEVNAAAKLDASYVSDIKFDKNQSALSAEAQEALTRLIQDAKSAGKIDEVKVAVWADRGYPAASKGKLNHKDRELADKRARAIADYLD